jgi:phage shock protein E
MRSRLAIIVVSALATVILAAPACSSGGDAAGSDAGGWTKVDATTLNDEMATGDVFLVNVHVPYEGEIPGTDAFIPYSEILQHLNELPSDPSTLVLYCRSGNMSTQAAQDLVNAGISGFSELEGGFYSWEDAGLPLEMDPSQT